jgi:hypothetical protein
MNDLISKLPKLIPQLSRTARKHWLFLVIVIAVFIIVYKAIHGVIAYNAEMGKNKIEFQLK